jgi:isocitrate dehydrogenase (NAD+)
MHTPQGKYTVTMIEGDGIGPEISQSVKEIFAAAKVKTAHSSYSRAPR